MSRLVSSWQDKVRVLGVSNPSPLKTCPRWPPHAAQVISVLVVKKLLSSYLLIAPGIAILCISTYDLNLDKYNSLTIIESGPPAPRFELCGTLIQRSPTSRTGIHTISIKLIVLARTRPLCSLIIQHIYRVASNRTWG